MKKLVVVADDFGLTPSVNTGILKAYQDGIVTEISLMIDAPATDAAINLIKNNNIDNVGIHLTLLGWKQLGKLLNRQDYNNLFQEKSSEEIRSLVETEIQTFIKLTGSHPTHIIPQYGIHGNLKLLKHLINFAQENNIALRKPLTALAGDFDANYAAEILLARSSVITADHLIIETEGQNLSITMDKIINQLKDIKAENSAELVTHPGYLDEDLLKMSSLSFERVRDLSMCLNSWFAQMIRELGFNLISYKELTHT